MPDSRLSTLRPGDSAVILGISADESLHHRLMALGFRTGREINLIRRASFSGPMQVRLGTTEVIIRLAEADKIRIASQSPQ